MDNKYKERLMEEIDKIFEEFYEDETDEFTGYFKVSEVFDVNGIDFLVDMISEKVVTVKASNSAIIRDNIKLIKVEKVGWLNYDNLDTSNHNGEFTFLTINNFSLYYNDSIEIIY